MDSSDLGRVMVVLNTVYRRRIGIVVGVPADTAKDKRLSIEDLNLPEADEIAKVAHPWKRSVRGRLIPEGDAEEIEPETFPAVAIKRGDGMVVRVCPSYAPDGCAQRDAQFIG